MIYVNGNLLPAAEAREDRVRAEYAARTISNALRVVLVAPSKRRYSYTTPPLDASTRAPWLALDGQVVTVQDPTGTWQGWYRARIGAWPYPGYATVEIEVEEL